MEELEPLPPGVVHSDPVRAGCDEDVSLPGVAATEDLLVVLRHLGAVLGQQAGPGVETPLVLQTEPPGETPVSQEPGDGAARAM